MRQGDLDAYIAEYEVLVEMAGYDPNSRLKLKIFTDGLPTELYKDALRLDRPRNYAEWKEAALTCHAEWIHLKHRNEQKWGVKLFNPFKPQYQPPHDPNAMDTSADRTRARQTKQSRRKNMPGYTCLRERTLIKNDPEDDSHPFPQGPAS